MIYNSKFVPNLTKTVRANVTNVTRYRGKFNIFFILNTIQTCNNVENIINCFQFLNNVKKNNSFCHHRAPSPPPFKFIIVDSDLAKN